MTRPLRSARYRASSLLRGGPPLRRASLLRPSRCLPLGRLALAPSGPKAHFADRGIAAQVPTFHTRAQAELAPPPCRTPPGQSAGSRQAHRGPEFQARFRCRLSVSTRQQWFTRVRLLDPHLTRSTARLFRDAHHPGPEDRRSSRWFAASPCRATAEDHQPNQGRAGPSISDAASPHRTGFYIDSPQRTWHTNSPESAES